MAVKTSKGGKLFIDGKLREATAIDIRIDPISFPENGIPNGVDVEFWPAGLWENGYRISKAGYDSMIYTEVDKSVEMRYRFFAGKAVARKSIWWRRLLRPIKKLFDKIQEA